MTRSTDVAGVSCTTATSSPSRVERCASAPETASSRGISNGAHTSGMTDATTPIALVTGTSAGIGLSTAVSLAAAGWTTIATMRDLRKADALEAAAAQAGVALDIRALDVTDHEAVASTIEALVAEHGRLDAVINN